MKSTNASEVRPWMLDVEGWTFRPKAVPPSSFPLTERLSVSRYYAFQPVVIALAGQHTRLEGAVERRPPILNSCLTDYSAGYPATLASISGRPTRSST